MLYGKDNQEEKNYLEPILALQVRMLSCLNIS